MEKPDILDSKIKRVQIELPHYSFSHSSAGDSSHSFIGREIIKEKLKKLVEDDDDKTGVYLITGNRGVGKTRLVNHVINQTSLQSNSSFSKNLRYLFLLFLAVAGIQFCVQEIYILKKNSTIIGTASFLIFVSSFILLCYFSSYRRKFFKQKICNYIKELVLLTNPYNPYEKMLYVFKIIAVVCFTQFFSIISFITPIIVLSFYLFVVFVYMAICKKYVYNREYEKEKKSKDISKCTFYLKRFILNPINSYIKKHNRLYLRINFGHKLKDEKDILRLIARTLSTEYHKYHSSFLRMLPWRVIALGLLILFAYLFSSIVEKQEFYKLIKEETLYKASSQVHLKDSIYLKDSTYLKVKDSIYIRKNFAYLTEKYFEHLERGNFSWVQRVDSTYLKIKDSVYWEVKNFLCIEGDKERLERLNSVYSKVDTTVKNKIGTKVSKFLLVLDELVFEMSKKIVKIPQCLWNGNGSNDMIEIVKFIPPINYLFWLSFLLIYLFFALLFHSNWVTHFFITHQIIKRQLKRLNSDITHRTEREYSTGIASTGSERIGPGIIARMKKSRNVADAREIEKELQDILDNMQRIPVVMCRPNIVIVFDELDKVEPGDTNSEKENLQTKASLFSIGAASERQTEILRILSNMKYFLSTASAKFIFIAGREMYDVHLADVSERNNYIGSIFNAVIHVPSFLTDHPTGKKKSGIASLPEEFVCRRLIPTDYPVKSYDLENYQMYLKRKMFYEQKEEIKQKIHKIIVSVRDKEIEQIKKIIDGQNEKQIEKIITEQKEEIEKNVKEIIASVENEDKETKKAITRQIIELQIKDIKCSDKNEKIKQKKIIAKQKIEQKNKNMEQKIKDIIISVGNEEIKQIKGIIASVENEQITKIIIEQNREIEQQINDIRNNEIQKVIAILQQFIIYLAHVSKGAPKKMMQLFESFIEVREIDKKEEEKCLVVQRYYSSRHFLNFNYYKQYTIGIIAYLITPIFNRLSESNIKEHSDKLLTSSLRFVDFLFKFHKHSFSWKILDTSPEMLEVNRAPELKSVVVDLLNYLTQVHINKSSFSISDYKFDGLIANEIFAMAKTDEVFSALFSFSLDETLPLKNHYQGLLEKTKKEYQYDKDSSVFIDAISSLQVVLGDLHYYDDELEEAETYYKSAVQALRNLGQKKYYKKEKQYQKADGKDEKMTLEQLYVYVRNMLRLGMIYEKRKQYDFAYLTYGELCKRIIRERNIAIRELRAGIVLRKEYDNEKNVFVKASTVGEVNKENKKYYDNIDIPLKFKGEIVEDSIASPQPLYFKNISPNTNDMLFKKMTFEGLKTLYLPFIAKLQILEKSHLGGIARSHLEQLEKEFVFLTSVIDHKEAKILEAEFYSRIADILYYKNSDLKCKKKKNRIDDENKDKIKNDGDNKEESIDNNDNLSKSSSCTACYYYHKALSILLNLDDKDEIKNKGKNTVIKLLSASVEQLKNNYNMKYCTALARILSDWGNVFFSCDKKNNECECCYICDAKDCNTQQKCYNCACHICNINDCSTNSLGTTLKKYINYIESESKQENRDVLLNEFKTRNNFSKMEIAFAMYTISLKAYCKANLYKRSAYQIYKMLCLFKSYKIYEKSYIKLSEKAINYLWHATENLNVFELNKRKKDFDKTAIKDKVPLQNLLVDSEIARIRILAKELELKSIEKPEDLKEYYDMRITSPYKINYSIVARIYRLRLKSRINYEAYQKLVYDEYENTDDIVKKNDLKKRLDILKNNKKLLGMEFILENKEHNENAIVIFGEYFDIKEAEDVTPEKKINILENLIAETIYCLIDIIELSETMDETYLFPHSFLGSIHEHLSFWVRLYEVYERDYYEKYKHTSQIDEYLKKYLGEEWREQLSGYRENKKALSHYYKCLEMHKEGRAYHNMIDTMCYVKDDYNDRSDHFNIAEERHSILNGKIEEKIKELKDIYKDSELYKVKNYFDKVDSEME
jgi:hypothetical protein